MRTRSLLCLALLLSLSACSTVTRHEPPPVARPSPPKPVVPACRDCGRISRVEMVSNVRPTANGGAVLGGVVGGVASGKSSTPAAKPGVQVLTFKIGVEMDDGRRLIVHQSELASGLRAGSRVRVVDGHVLALR